MIWSLVNYVPIQGSEKKIDFKACSLGKQHSNNYYIIIIILAQRHFLLVLLYDYFW